MLSTNIPSALQCQGLEVEPNIEQPVNADPTDNVVGGSDGSFLSLLAPLLCPLACNVIRTGSRPQFSRFDPSVRQCWRWRRRLKMRYWWENPHISLTARTSFAGRAYPAYFGRITQIFGDRKFAWDKIAGCKGWKTCNRHTSSPFYIEPIIDNFHPHTSYSCSLLPTSWSTHCRAN